MCGSVLVEEPVSEIVQQRLEFVIIHHCLVIRLVLFSVFIFPLVVVIFIFIRLVLIVFFVFFA